MIGAIGEVIGGVFVIVTVAYLALQIRRNTSALRSEATSSAATLMQSWYLAIGNSEQTSRVWFRGMTKPDSLSKEDFFQFTMMTHAAMLGFQNSIQLAEHGSLEVEVRESITNTLISAQILPGFEVYWKQRGPMFNKAFRDYVEDLQSREGVSMQELYQRRDTA